MQTWQMLSIMTVVLWGVWGVLAKLSVSQGTSPLLLAMLSSGAGLSVVAIFQLLARFPLDRPPLGVMYGLLAGAAGGLGAILFFHALRDGKASVVVPITACYPVLTIILGVMVLKEQLSPAQGIGIGLAVTGMVLLSL